MSLDNPAFGVEELSSDDDLEAAHDILSVSGHSEADTDSSGDFALDSEIIAAADDSGSDSESGESSADDSSDVAYEIVNRHGKRVKVRGPRGEDPCINAEGEAIQSLSKHPKLGCSHCLDADISVKTNTAKAKQHTSPKSHMEAEKLSKQQNKHSVTAASSVPPFDRQLYKKLRRDVTALIGSAVPKSLIGFLYDPALLRAVLLLHDAPVTVKFGEAGTVARDFKAAELTHSEQITRVVAGHFGALLLDGATSKFDGGLKPTAVLFASETVGKPVLIDVITDSSVSPAVKMAKQVKRSLESVGIDITTQVTALVGNNVAFTDALAAALDLPHAKCIIHSLNLVFQAMIDSFPKFVKLTTALNGLLTAGGTVKRVEELQSAPYSLKVNDLRSHENRWGSLLSVAEYFYSRHDRYGKMHGGVLAVVRDWLKSGKSLKRKKKTAALVPDAEADDPELSHLEETVRLFDDAEAAAELFIVLNVMRPICDLITEASGNAVSASFPTSMEAFQQALLIARDYPLSTVRQSFEDSAYTMTVEQRTAAEARLTGALRTGIAAALTAYDKHVKVAMEFLSRKLMYDPRVRPKEFKDGVDLRAFFGCTRDQARNSTLLPKYIEYFDHWPTMSKFDIGSPAIFWKEQRSRYGILADIARWHCEIPTSSVAAERSFGVMRTMERPTRLRMEASTLRQELKYQVNRGLLLEQVAQAVEEARAKGFLKDEGGRARFSDTQMWTVTKK